MRHKPRQVELLGATFASQKFQLPHALEACKLAMLPQLHAKILYDTLQYAEAESLSARHDEMKNYAIPVMVKMKFPLER